MPDNNKKTTKYGRFSVQEVSSGYQLLDRKTGNTHWLSDGVDALSTANGKPVRCGTEYFRRLWTRVLNQSEGETLEAYFPDVAKRENSN